MNIFFCLHPINQSSKHKPSQSASKPPPSVSQSFCCGRVEVCRRALCLSREAPDTTVAGPGPLQWPSTQSPTHWDNGPGSEWGWVARLRLPTCTLQERTLSSPPTHSLHPPSVKELLQVSSCVAGWCCAVFFFFSFTAEEPKTCNKNSTGQKAWSCRIDLRCYTVLSLENWDNKTKWDRLHFFLNRLPSVIIKAKLLYV